MKKVTKTMYEAVDGSLHETEKECLARDAKVERERLCSAYFIVAHDFDCTEGRGYYKRAYVLVRMDELNKPTPAMAKLLLEEFLTSTFNRVSWIQGVQPVPAWNIHDCTEEQFHKIPHEETREGMQTTYKMSLYLMNKWLVRR